MSKSANPRLWMIIMALSAMGLAACVVRSETGALPVRIRGFHIDMNIAQFQGSYLKKKLKDLADLGYNTIIWEVENNIRWETCPECVSPDAFTKAEFKDILAYSRDLGLEPIPLLQTLGHCEYVLKNERYRPLAEIPDRIDQYCPRNPEVVTFLRKWIDEYLEVFGPVRYFHLGADEAYTLGECPRCKAYVSEHSLSDLFIEHINAMSQPLIEKGIRPVIWGDMLLNHPESLARLSRRVVVFDWRYDRYYGVPTVFIWGRGELTKEKPGRRGSRLPCSGSAGGSRSCRRMPRGGGAGGRAHDTIDREDPGFSRNPLQRDAPQAGGAEVRVLGVSDPAEAGQFEDALAGHGVGAGQHQWLTPSGDAEAGWPGRALAQGGREGTEGRGRGCGRCRHAGDCAGRARSGAGAGRARRFAESAGGRVSEDPGGVGGHHPCRAARFRVLGSFGEAVGDPGAAGRECLRHAGEGEAAAVLLRSIGDVCQEPELPCRRGREVRRVPR